MKTKSLNSKYAALRREIMDKYGTFVILLAMMLVMTLIKGTNFLSLGNLTNIMRQQSVIGIIALGVMLTIITGGTDLSGGSVLALCSCVIATFAHGDYPLIVPVMMGILVGAATGLVNGFFIAYGHVPPFIMTLGMMSAARGLALIVSNSKPINGFTDAFDAIGAESWFGIPIAVWLLIAMTVLFYFLLHKSKFGTYVYAIGGNQTAAKVSGINVKTILTIVYTIAGACTGLAALIMTSRTLAGNPSYGTAYEMDAITCCIIGGTSFTGGIGRAVNTTIGAFIMGVLTNGMTMLQIDPNSQQVIKGAVIVLAVLLDERKNRRS